MNRERQSFPFSTTDWQLFRVAAAALNQVSDTEERIVEDAFSSGAAFSVMTLSAQYWNERAIGKRDVGEPIMFDSTQTEQILEIVTQKVEKAAGDGTLHTTPYLDRALLFWATRRGKQAVGEYATSLAEEESGLADLVVASIGNVYLSSSGRRYSASLKFLEELGFSPADVATQCEGWLAAEREWMTELRRDAIETFVDAVRNPRDEFGFPRTS